MLLRKVLFWVIVVLCAGVVVVVFLWSLRTKESPVLSEARPVGFLPAEFDVEGRAEFVTPVQEKGDVLSAEVLRGEASLRLEDEFGNVKTGSQSVELVLSRNSTVRVIVEKAKPETRIRFSSGLRTLIATSLPWQWEGRVHQDKNLLILTPELPETAILEVSFSASGGLGGELVAFDEAKREVSSELSGAGRTAIELVVSKKGICGVMIHPSSNGELFVGLRLAGYQHKLSALPAKLEVRFEQGDAERERSHRFVLPEGLPEKSYILVEVEPEQGLDVGVLCVELDEEGKVSNWDVFDEGAEGEKEFFRFVCESGGMTVIEVTDQRGTGSFTFSAEHYGRQFTIESLPYHASRDLRPPDRTSRRMDIYRFTEPLLGKVSVLLSVPETADMDLTLVGEDGERKRAEKRARGGKEEILLDLNSPTFPLIIVDCVEGRGTYRLDVRKVR